MHLIQKVISGGCESPSGSVPKETAASSRIPVLCMLL